MRNFRITAYTLMAIVLAWAVATEITSFTICTPFSAYWNTDEKKHCNNQHIFDIIDSLPWIITDFAVIIAPLPIVFKLHMQTKQKVALAGLFLLGGLCVHP